MYQVIDLQTKEVISTHRTRQQARRKADKLDWNYGAIQHAVIEVKP